jgi:2-oxoglutarate ferredoxin oxidoreductase subunit delta
MISKKTKTKETESKYHKRCVNISPKWCVKCKVCIDACPNKVLALNDYGIAEVIKPVDCTMCNDCVVVCPGFAITLIEKGNTKTFFQLLGGKT